MRPADVVTLLEGFGFNGLKPLSIKDDVYTFKFLGHNYRYLTKTFGKPSVASEGKVAVFEIPGYGRLGVSPSNSLVRLIYKGNHVKREVDNTHLAKLPVSEELRLLFAKAQVSANLRVTYLERAFAYFNRTKFHGKLVKIPIKCTSQHPPQARGINARTRAFFQPGMNAYFWFRSSLFNADIDFVNEIVVHEFCHQAVYIDLGHVELEDLGHGPKWKEWMRKVGLDPRQFDPTQDYVYTDTLTRNLKEEETTLKYGPRTPLSFFKGKEKATSYKGPSVKYALSHEGRAFVGTIKQVGARYEFTGKAPNGKPYTFTLPAWKPNITWIM